MSGLFLSPGHSASAFVGVQRIIKPPIPNAGAELTFLLPGGSYWRVLSGRVPFATSAVVANRVVRFQESDGTDVFYRLGVPAPVTATQSIEFNVLPLVTLSTTLSLALTGIQPIPDLVLPGGFVISTNTFGMDAGDQYGQSVWFMEEIDQGPLGNQLGLVPFDSGSRAGGEE